MLCSSAADDETPVGAGVRLRFVTHRRDVFQPDTARDLLDRAAFTLGPAATCGHSVLGTLRTPAAVLMSTDG